MRDSKEERAGLRADWTSILGGRGAGPGNFLDHVAEFLERGMRLRPHMRIDVALVLEGWRASG